MNSQGKQTSSYNPSIEHLRFIFAVLVVFIHTYGRGVLPGEVMSDVGWVAGVQRLFSHTLPSVAVPGFFLISGLLYFTNMRQWSWERYLQSLRRRVITLLLPFFVWNMMKLVSLCIPSFMHDGWEGILRVVDDFGGWRIFWDGNPDCSSPILLATWFLRDLMVFCLLAPLIHFLVRRVSFTLFFMLMWCAFFDWWPTENVCNPLNLAFYVLGATFSIKGKDMFAFFSTYSKWSYLLAFFTFLLNVCYSSSVTVLVFLSFAIVALCNGVSYGKRFLNRTIPPLCTQATMFIYLGHSFLVLSGVTWILVRVIPFGGEAWVLIRYFLIPPITIALLLFVFYFLRRDFSKVLYVLLGRRF
ncbi:MAG: acyltransferase [Bacteroidaceae bacterium]|nr:acyltransferase [Bacteroidaceae bacterium]